jgi:hypothetical protein
MDDIDDKNYITQQGENVTITHVSPLPVVFCKVDGPFVVDMVHFSNPMVQQHPDVLRYIQNIP